MQLSLPFIDIIIFAIIAVFLIYRLKNILGEKSGYDTSEEENKKHLRRPKVSNVVDFSTSNKNSNKLDNKINEIILLDNNFSVDDFLSGAKVFFEMVINSFVKGDLSNIKNYVKASLINDFQSVITERNKDKESLIINIKNIQNTIIQDIIINKSTIKIQVLFESKQIKALKDKDDKVIDGDLDKVILVRDLWRFERDVNNSDNKNWTLIETTIA